MTELYYASSGTGETTEPAAGPALALSIPSGSTILF